LRIRPEGGVVWEAGKDGMVPGRQPAAPEPGLRRPTNRTEGTGAFRPLKTDFKNCGFSHGLFVYVAGMQFAHQKARA
jgi:hypothetical protein